MDVRGELYPEEVYPDYCDDKFFIMSNDVAASVINASISLPYFAIDDIYITGMLIQSIGIRHIDISETVVPRESSSTVFANPSEWWKYSLATGLEDRIIVQIWHQMKALARDYSIPTPLHFRPGKFAENYIPFKLLA